VRTPEERLQDILEAIAAIERYVVRGKEAFEQDELLQGWFVRHLQIIGEAARSLPEEIKALAPDIEWGKMIGMRNILVHGYFEVDTEIVWSAVAYELPALKTAIQDLFRKLEKQKS